MAKRVRFRGYRAIEGGMAPRAFPPLTGLWAVGESRLFDGQLARSLNRACSPTCDGDCFADAFCRHWNTNHDTPAFVARRIRPRNQPSVSAGDEPAKEQP